MQVVNRLSMLVKIPDNFVELYAVKCINQCQKNDEGKKVSCFNLIIFTNWFL